MLTLLLPESRPPRLDLSGPPEEQVAQPGLFDTLPTGPRPCSSSARARMLARAGEACTSALVDILAGRRGPHQLARWSTETVLTDLVMLARAVHRHPIRTGPPYVQVVGDRAAEIVIGCRPARGEDWAPLRVLTARIEPYADRWHCCHLGWIAGPPRAASGQAVAPDPPLRP
ncbi:Rv3235 family protein [Raineyella sp. LH-20]|uniref:Rv3235 family protein n=1 Tax=Raineyella sp. LH-20 TaxID=3081204 RepID=UPI002953358D|nr:Rv3235 family protein [Raineyella sp. LH-20]WOP17872.1 Rv3235 family protein [Raineyella sp. LH-20]